MAAASSSGMRSPTTNLYDVPRSLAARPVPLLLVSLLLMRLEGDVELLLEFILTEGCHGFKVPLPIVASSEPIILIVAYSHVNHQFGNTRRRSICYPADQFLRYAARLGKSVKSNGKTQFPCPHPACRRARNRNQHFVHQTRR